MPFSNNKILQKLSWASAGKIIAAFINLSALIAYSRLLEASVFGILVLAQSCVYITYNIFFMWIERSITRFIPERQTTLPSLLGGILGGYLLSSIAILILGCLTYWIWPTNSADWLHDLIYVIFLAIIGEAICAATIEMQAALSQLRKLAILTMARAGLTLGFAVILSLNVEATPYYILLGHSIGTLVTFMIGCIVLDKRQLKFSGFLSELKILAKFGTPLSIAMIFRILIQRADRFVIHHFLGAEAVAIYSIAFDFSRRVLGVALMIVNLVYYPLIVRAKGNSEPDKCNALLRQNSLGLCLIGFSGVAGLWAVAPNAVATLFGPSYAQDPAQIIMGIACVCMLLEAIKIHHYDLAFLLAKKTGAQIPFTALALALNLILLIGLIPALAIQGAAIAALCTYIALLISSMIWGRHHMHIPFERLEMLKVLFLALGMSAGVSILPGSGPIALSLHIIAGATLFTFGLWFFNIANIRSLLLNKGRSDVSS